MKLCDTCIYGDKTEYFKPCIIYRDDCEMYEEKKMTKRENAIEVLQELWRYKYTSKYTEEEIRQALMVAINSLQIDEQYDLAMEQAEPTGWIPVSERLPEENGDYLVTLENGVVEILGYSTTQRTTYPKGFYYVEGGFSWRQTINPVIAWMPLPEPYNADMRGDNNEIG